ncbi:MAG: hypothetical protein KAH21_03510, partial [Spirochaetaceae bacterium]|nr:hypothetical protein [Spirochaetaceae bacterium]
MKKFHLILLLLIVTAFSLQGFEVTLTGGARMDIPEAWELDSSDPSVPSWYSPDRRSATDVMLWEPGTWEKMEDFVESVRPDGAEGDVFVFSSWEGEAALANWSFLSLGEQFRGWFLLTTGTGPDVRISAIAAEEEFSERQTFLLSVLDSYIPGDQWRLTPGAVSTFLEVTSSGNKTVAVSIPFGDKTLGWEESSAGNQAAQDVIEREALVLSAYASVPELFYPAWERYYRIIYRDSYTRLESLIEALQNGPLPSDEDPRIIAEKLLSWLQGFSYGSTEGFSDLLSPSAACSSQTGDCD